jgi:membrane dipeptidase
MRLFDLHCDTIYECAVGGHGIAKNNLQLDLKRGLKYDKWGQVFAVWMPDSLRGDEAWRQCEKMLQYFHKEAQENSQQMIVVNSADDLETAMNTDRCAAILAVEGGSALAGRIETLDLMSSLKVKIITLTWNGSNELGHGCMSDCKDGLTDFGKQAVTEMEKRNIIPDVSHLNNAGFWDVMQYSSGVVIASHSVSAKIFSHKRNLDEEQFAAIQKRGGLVGLTLCGAQLGQQTFDCIERHLDHYLSLNGENTVAFGCDFDGTDLPPGWGGIEVLQKIYEYFQSKNYDEALLDRIFFGNCYDFFVRL